MLSVSSPRPQATPKDPAVLKPSALNPKPQNPKTLNPKTPKTLNPKTLNPKTLNPKTPKPQNPAPHELRLPGASGALGSKLFLGQADLGENLHGPIRLR